MLIVLDERSPEALYKQIATQLRLAISTGRLGEGERLPTAKTLSTSLGVNLHTVLRAYSLLRDEGLIQMRRGRGTTVRAPKEPRTPLSALAKSLLEEARRQGVSREEVAELVTELASELQWKGGG